MKRFVIRVDDCGWTPDKANDVGLAYYQSWRAACGFDERPVPYVAAFIPSTLTVNEIAILREISRRELDPPIRHGRQTIAVHGWDHAVGAVVTSAQMKAAYRSMVVPATCNYSNQLAPFVYVAPFNRYDRETVKAFADAACDIADYRDQAKRSGFAPTFLGGFPGDEQSAQYGGEAVVAERFAIHAPATFDWYKRAHQLVEALEALPRPTPEDYNARHTEAPIVLTLHITWDADHFAGLKRFFDAVAPFAVDVSAIADHLRYENRCTF